RIVFGRVRRSRVTIARMITRRDAVRLLGSASAGLWLAPAFAAKVVNPLSPERLAVIEAFKKKSEGLQDRFEARTHKGEWTMPYRLFRPASSAKLPLVIYLHGSGGQGDDNE